MSAFKKATLVVSPLIIAAFVTACQNQQATPPTGTSSSGVNKPPVITALVAQPDTFVMGTSTEIICTAVDENGDELTYEWYDDVYGEMIPKGNKLTYYGEACCGGDSEVTVVVSDGRGGETEKSISVYGEF